MAGIEIIQHKTLRSCFDACFDDQDPIRSITDTGKVETITRAAYMKERRTSRCFGFANFGEQRIEIWHAKNVSPGRLVQMIAHELAHLRRPRFRDKRKEEIKAGDYGQVAFTAYKIMRQLRGLH